MPGSGSNSELEFTIDIHHREQKLHFMADVPNSGFSIDPDGNITVDFTSLAVSNVSIVFRSAQAGLLFDGFTASRIANRNSPLALKILREGEVADTPFRVSSDLDDRSKIVVRDTFSQEFSGVFFYFLLYRVGDTQFIFDPEIKNEGEPGGPLALREPMRR